MIEATDLDLIDKYLRRELTAEDAFALEERKKSKDFSELLSEMEAIAVSISEVGVLKLRDEMEQWYQEEVHVKKSKPKLISLISLAASFLLLCGLIVWNYSAHKYERLSHSFAADFPDYVSQVKRGEESDDMTYALLMTPYRNRDWKEALSGFDTYLSDHPGDFKIELYQGIAMFQNKDNENAIVSLHGVLNKTENTTFTEPARWYLILAYLADNQVDKAKQLLTSLIANQQHFEYNKARELLNILSK